MQARQRVLPVVALHLFEGCPIVAPQQVWPFKENFAQHREEFGWRRRPIVIDANVFAARATALEILETSAEGAGPGG